MEREKTMGGELDDSKEGGGGLKRERMENHHIGKESERN